MKRILQKEYEARDPPRANTTKQPLTNGKEATEENLRRVGREEAEQQRRKKIKESWEKSDREPAQGKYADFLEFLCVPWRGWNEISETRQLGYLGMAAVARAYKAKWELSLILKVVDISMDAMKAVAAKEAADALVNGSPLDWGEHYSTIEDAYEETTDNFCKGLAAMKQGERK
jgi:hypothetical protein